MKTVFPQRLPIGTSVAIALSLAMGCDVRLASNCGGNNAARAQAHAIYLQMVLAAAEHPTMTFSLSLATHEQRQRLAELARNTWTGDARYLVTLETVAFKTGHRKLIVVCDQAYRNVPESVIGEAPPTHAAVYSDGTVELIGEDAFRDLDLDAFVSLDELGDDASKGKINRAASRSRMRAQFSINPPGNST